VERVPLQDVSPLEGVRFVTIGGPMVESPAADEASCGASHRRSRLTHAGDSGI
jgi:hypothetical protein